MSGADLSYKNYFCYLQEKFKETPKKLSKPKRQKESENVSKNISNDNRSNYLSRSTSYTNTNDKSKSEDHQKITKKYYYIITQLQEEIVKETIKNISLLKKNRELKEKLSKIKKK